MKRKWDKERENGIKEEKMGYRKGWRHSPDPQCGVEAKMEKNNKMKDKKQA